MSKGSPLLTIRIPAELLQLVDQAIARSVDTRRDGPWNRSSFIVKAIAEKLAKMARCAGRTSPVPPTYRRDLSTF
jgi:metal-responsive CopG/Arc/MetJ family transcriptional regulator